MQFQVFMRQIIQYKETLNYIIDISKVLKLKICSVSNSNNRDFSIFEQSLLANVPLCMQYYIGFLQMIYHLNFEHLQRSS